MNTEKAVDGLQIKTTVSNKTLIGFTVASFVLTVILLFVMYVRYVTDRIAVESRMTQLETQLYILNKQQETHSKDK